MSRWLGVAVLVFGIFGTACVATNGCAEGHKDTKRAEEMCRRFVETRMTTELGGIYTSSRVGGSLFKRPDLDPAELRTSGLLSESNGLLMRYAVEAGDRELFDRQYAFVRKWMTGHLGLFFWKISHDAELTADATAVVDDLRIVDAVLRAFDRWGEPEHRRFALEVAYAVAENEAVDGVFRDFVNWRDWGERTLSPRIQLSYLDMPAIRRIARSRDDWDELVEKNGDVLSKGQLDSGLFWEAYDFEKRAYVGPTQNTINQLYSALFLAEIDPGNQEALKFFRERWNEDGRILAEYDARNGRPTKFFESTSVYALLARYALVMGDRGFAAEIVDRLLRYQDVHEGGPLAGAFYDDEIYSFDNLEAMLTLRLFNSANTARMADSEHETTKGKGH